ncbi:MAG: amidohydrolase family protein [Candidatus Bathyarchaeota archaeon]|nr:amidohydrolase family protein [Candidatus Bathyarchaeota archaeon]
MVIIDAHCHLSPRRSKASSLVESMDPAGIDMACVFGNDNEFVAEAAKNFPDRFIPFVYFDPRYEEIGVETVEKYAIEYGWKGVKVGHQHAVARFMYPMMEKAEEHKMIVVIHSDHSIRNHPYVIGDIANSFPKVPTVILHMGGGTCFDSELLSTKIAQKNENIYLETCYSNPFAIKQAVETLGSERIMFGSDESNGGYGSRFEKPGQYQDLMLDAVRVIGLQKDQEEAVLGGTAAKLLGIDR